MKTTQTAKESVNPSSKQKDKTMPFFSPAIQPKLSINQPNDVYEQEADAVADQVMRMKDTSLHTGGFFKPSLSQIQRKCAECEEEEKQRQVHLKPDPSLIQRQPTDEYDKPETQPQPASQPVDTPAPVLPNVPNFQLPPPESIDYLGINRSFLNRGLSPYGYGDAAKQEWSRQYQLYSTLGAGNVLDKTFIGGTLRFFGVTPPDGDWNAWLSNQTTPKAIDSALSKDYPNLNEQEERRGGLPAPTIINLPGVNFKKKDGSIDPSQANQEQEADNIANAVMQSRSEVQPQSFFLLQRKCAHCEEEEKLQRKEDNAGETKTHSSTENYINTLSGGKPLGEEEKSFFEQRIGYDFSNVRVHNDSTANASAKEVNALAYAHGNHIVFGANEYQPATDDGKKLIAHELTHVVQQGNKQTVQRKENNDSKEQVSVKILWQGTVFASLYYFIRPVCKSEEEAKQIVGQLLLNNSFVYLLNNGNDVPLKDFEQVENFEKTKTINVYDSALQIILDATGNKTKEEFFKVLAANKVVDQKASQLIKELKAEGFDIHYENSWLDSFIKGLGQSSLSSSFMDTYNKMKDNATSWEKGPAFYTGINLGFPAGVAEDVWDNIKGIFLLAWQLVKAQFEMETDPIGFYNKIKEEISNLWQVISTDPEELGKLAGNALGSKIKKDFVNVNSFNQGFALGEIVGKVATEIALLFVGVEEVAALAKVAEGTKIGGMISKALRESEMIGKVGKLIKGEKGVVAADEGSKALTETEKIEEMVKAAQKASEESKPSAELIKLERELFETKVKETGNILEVTEKELIADYDVEVKVGDHTYRRKIEDGTWCRFSTKICDLHLDNAAVNKQKPRSISSGTEPVPVEPRARGYAIEDSHLSDLKGKGWNGLPDYFPSIDGVKGGTAKNVMREGQQVRQIEGAEVLSVKSTSITDPVTLQSNMEKYLAALKRNTFSNGELFVRNVKSKNLHLIFEQGFISKVENREVLKALQEMKKTAAAEGVNFEWFVIPENGKIMNGPQFFKAQKALLDEL